MDTALVETLPVPPSTTESSSVTETHISSIAQENAPPSGAAGGRPVTSRSVLESGRRRQTYRETPSGDAGRATSRLATPSGLVTEVNLTRQKRDSEVSKSSSSRRTTTVDIDNSDLETVLGEDDSLNRRIASFQDTDTMSRHIYLKKCEELGVVPISLVVRKIGAKELNLRNRQCGPTGARAIAVPLVYNKSIVALDLSCNNIEDSGIRPICECLTNNVSVRELRLAENHLTLDGLKEIGRLILLNKIITDLDISGNHFGDVSAKVLQKIIEESRTLKFLDLSNNNLGIESGVLLGQAIGSNESLEELKLCWNHIRRDGAVALVDGLKENVRLRRLDVSWNGFGQETAKSLSACIAENEGLVDLNLAGNRLNDEAMVIMAKGLKQNEKLEKLVLIKNPITNVGAFALLAGVKQNENSGLELIDMKDVCVRDDFLVLLSDVQEVRPLEVLYNAGSLKPHILDPMDVVMAHIMDKGMDVDNTFNLVPGRDGGPTEHTEKEHFIAQLKKEGVPLSHNQLTQLASDLMEADVGLVNLRTIIEAASDLQAETASAATSASFDGLSSVLGGSSEVAPSAHSPTPDLPVTAPAKKTARKEREPIQAGQQYSW